AGVDLELRDVVDGVGEVCLRSPAVMDGYWRAPDLTKAVVTPDGFVRTGDLGWIDDDGRLRLVGRSKEMYVRGGYNVYPMEVEAVLATHPAVADIAIAPRPDDVMGEIGVAVVVPREGADAPSVDDLQAFAVDRLARYKLPEEVVVVAEELGKVLALGPLLTTIAGFVPLVREAEGGDEWLAKVAAGEISGTAGFTRDHILCGAEVDHVAVVLEGEIAIATTSGAQEV